MKRHLAILLILTLSPTLFGQEGASNWGKRILFGTSFTRTDSTRLLTSSLRDTVLADTMYSGILGIGDKSEGIYAIASHLTNVGGGSDSLKLEVRLVDQQWDSNAKTTTINFGPWNTVFSLMTATAVSDTLITDGTSSWWRPATGRQYRLYDTSVSTDTTLHKISDYLR